MPFELIETKLKDIKLIKPKTFQDNRGLFFESYKESDFHGLGIKDQFVQDNQSKSVKGVLRGLHFQTPPKEQAKLVRCIRGEIFDVAVDLRKESPDYLKWEGFKLSEENRLMLYIPEGFAHGFLTLSKEAEITYKISGAEYSPDHDAGIIWNDEKIGIEWPFEEAGIKTPELSQKDSKLPPLS